MKKFNFKVGGRLPFTHHSQQILQHLAAWPARACVMALAAIVTAVLVYTYVWLPLQDSEPLVSVDNGSSSFDDQEFLQKINNERDKRVQHLSRDWTYVTRFLMPVMDMRNEVQGTPLASSGPLPSPVPSFSSTPAPSPIVFTTPTPSL